jgi:hypothetical protein
LPATSLPGVALAPVCQALYDLLLLELLLPFDPSSERLSPASNQVTFTPLVKFRHPPVGN